MKCTGGQEKLVLRVKNTTLSMLVTYNELFKIMKNICRTTVLVIWFGTHLAEISSILARASSRLASTCALFISYAFGSVNSAIHPATPNALDLNTCVKQKLTLTHTQMIPHRLKLNRWLEDSNIEIMIWCVRTVDKLKTWHLPIFKHEIQNKKYLKFGGHALRNVNF